MRQRVMSPEGSLAHSAISFRCRAASARHVESACSCETESCSPWYLVAAVSAAAWFHLYWSTKHCAVPFASIVILLHSRTSAAFWAADLKHARADAVTAAANQAFVQRIMASSGRLENTYRNQTHRHSRSDQVNRRTGWDSNPRYPCGHTGFRDRPFQPLTHLSINRWRTGYRNRRTDAQTHRRTDAQGRTGESYQVGPSVDCSLFTPAASARLPPVLCHLALHG